MSTTRIARELLAVLLALASAVPSSSRADAPRATGESRARPNVVVVVIDDMGWEDFYFVPTPNMARLAQSGRLYTNFYVHPVCSPSRVSLNFGLHGRRVGVTGALNVSQPGARGVPVDHLALATCLHVEGYATACFGKWHVSGNEVHSREMARVFGYEHWRGGNRSNLGSDRNSTHFDWLRFDDGHVTATDEYSSAVAVDEFVEWWHEPDERPRFAVVNLFTPHEPFSVPPVELLPDGFVAPAPTDEPRVRFEAAVMAVDTLVGRVAATVDLSNTVLFVMPDNGPPFSARPPSAWYRGYKLTCWQGGIHVPLIAAGVGVVRGPTEHLTHVVDLPRTILDLCGGFHGHGFDDSVSFAPSLAGEQGPRAPVFVEFEDLTPNDDSPRTSWAVIDSDGYKLLHIDGEQRLFDLGADPRETLEIDGPARVRRLERTAHEVLR